MENVLDLLVWHLNNRRTIYPSDEIRQNPINQGFHEKIARTHHLLLDAVVRPNVDRRPIQTVIGVVYG